MSASPSSTSTRGCAACAEVAARLGDLGLHAGRGRRVPATGSRVLASATRTVPVVRLLVVGGKLQGTEARLPGRRSGLRGRARRPPRARAGRRPGRRGAHARRDRRRRAHARAGAQLRRRAARLRRRRHAGVARRARARLGRAAALRSARLRGHLVEGALRELFERLDVPRPLPWPALRRSRSSSSRASGSGSHGVRIVADEPRARAGAGRRSPPTATEMVAEEYVAGTVAVVRGARLGGRRRDAAGDGPRVRRGLRLQAGHGSGRGRARGDGGAPRRVRRRVAAAGGGGRPARRHGRRGDGRRTAGRRCSRSTPACRARRRPPCCTPAGSTRSSLLYETVAGAALPRVAASAARGAVYQHVRVTDGRVEVLGEHVVGAAGPLRRHDGLWGADVVLTDRDAAG